MPIQNPFALSIGTIVANNNITEWAGVTLGSPSNYGTSPGAVEVIGVNAFVTNVVTVVGNLTNDNAAPAANNIGVLPAVANAVAPTYTEGYQVLLSTDLTGALRITGSISATNPSVSATGSPVPADATMIGGSDGTDLQAIAVDASGQVKVLLENSIPAGSNVIGHVITDSGSTTAVTGTVAVTQSGTWTVGISAAQTIAVTNAGTFAVQDAAAETFLATLAGTVTAGKIAVTQGTSPWVVSLASTTITGSVSVTQGTSPWVVSLASTTITGTVAVTQSTSPWVVSNGGTFAVQAASTIADGADVTQGAKADARSTATDTTAITIMSVLKEISYMEQNPASRAVTNAGTFAVQAACTQSTSPWVVAGGLTNNNAAPSTNNVGALVGLANAAAPTYVEGDQVLLSTDLSGALRVNVGSIVATNNITEWAGVTLGSPSNYGTAPGAVEVIGVNAFITNTPTVNQGTSPWVVSLTSTTITGTVSVTQGTSPWVVSNSGTFAVQATLAAETTKVIGTVNQGTSPWVVSLTSTTITGTVAVTQSTSPWVIAGGLTNNNAAPSTNNVGVLGYLANAAVPTWTEGDLVLGSVDLKGNQRVILNTLPVAAASGDALANPTITQIGVENMVFNGTSWDRMRSIATGGGTGVVKAGICGASSGAALILDAAPGASSVPAGALAVGGGYNTSAPSNLFNGYFGGLQLDNSGSLFVRRSRRSQVVSQATTIASTNVATTVLAAQASGVFSDISTLIITPTSAAVTSLQFTVTLSDGTNNYIFDMDTGTIAASSPDLVLPFDPPLPAASSATAWTIALSVNTVTVHVTVVASIQKAS